MKAPKIRQPRNFTLHPVANMELLAASVQGSGESCFKPSEMRRLSGLNLEDLDFDGSPGETTSDRFCHAMPGHVGDVQQSVHAAQIHECTEIGEAANRAANHSAFLQLGQPSFAAARFFLFQNHAAINHNIFAGRIELDDPALDLLAYQTSPSRPVP